LVSSTTHARLGLLEARHERLELGHARAGLGQLLLEAVLLAAQHLAQSALLFGLGGALLGLGLEGGGVGHGLLARALHRRPDGRARRLHLGLPRGRVAIRI